MERIITVLVKPNSRKGPLVEEDPDGILTLYVRAPAVEGKANTAAVELLAAHLGLPKRRVTLIAGQTARHKRFRVDDHLA